MKIELYYDKECPFCKFYANYIELKKRHKLLLLNARDEKEQIEKLKSKGFDINNGFIIIVNDFMIFQGADAIYFINRISKKKFYFPNNLFFKNIIYLLIKVLRKILLFILRRNQKI